MTKKRILDNLHIFAMLLSVFGATLIAIDIGKTMFIYSQTNVMSIPQILPLGILIMVPANLLCYVLGEVLT